MIILSCQSILNRLGKLMNEYGENMILELALRKKAKRTKFGENYKGKNEVVISQGQRG